jgi:hypothetical protein
MFFGDAIGRLATKRAKSQHCTLPGDLVKSWEVLVHPKNRIRGEQAMNPTGVYPRKKPSGKLTVSELENHHL